MNTVIVNTLGHTRVALNGIECVFHIVPDGIPIPHDDISDSEFLKQNKATLCFYQENITIDKKSTLINESNHATIILPLRATSLSEKDGTPVVCSYTIISDSP